MASRKRRAMCHSPSPVTPCCLPSLDVPAHKHPTQRAQTEDRERHEETHQASRLAGQAIGCPPARRGRRRPWRWGWLAGWASWQEGGRAEWVAWARRARRSGELVRPEREEGSGEGAEGLLWGVEATLAVRSKVEVEVRAAAAGKPSSCRPRAAGRPAAAVACAAASRPSPSARSGPAPNLSIGDAIRLLETSILGLLRASPRVLRPLNRQPAPPRFARCHRARDVLCGREPGASGKCDAAVGRNVHGKQPRGEWNESPSVKSRRRRCDLSTGRVRGALLWSAGRAPGVRETERGDSADGGRR